MAAEVETMFSSRIVPWHGLGTVTKEALTSQDALHTAQLDWSVNPTPVTVNGIVVPGYQANVRDSDNSVLGIVSNKYKIVQNKEAFDFTDALIENHEMQYESAGSLRNGKTVWLLGKMPEEKILDDKLDPYICFCNTFDGTGAVKVISTNIRVVCMNTLDMALRNAKRTWSFKHMGSMQEKLDDARRSLELCHKYIEELNVEADKLANTSMSDTEIHSVIKQLFPIEEEMSDCKIRNAQRNRDALYSCLDMDDIKKFKNTQWGFLNAVTDFRDHVSPNRMTNTYKENRFLRVLGNENILHNAQDILAKIA